MTDVRPWVEAFAPATVSNLGPGFDCLGLALRERGDTVRARKGDSPGVTILRIEGDGGRLPLDAGRNTASVAVRHMLERFAPKASVELELKKGLPLGSGLGSSGASAAAAVVAADSALQLGLPSDVLVEAARHAEGIACGTPHPDNVAPAIVGGVVLIPSLDPLRLVSLPAPEGLWVTVYTPGCEVNTADARAVLPEAVSVADCVGQAARLGMLVHALHLGDMQMLGEAVVDRVAEPHRARLIPGYIDAKAAACEAGALCCSISGAGPTTFTLAEDEHRAKALLEILEEQYTHAGVPGEGLVDRVGPGARVTSQPLH
ncbi:MAG: homoserine kinase [Nannocystales bacterium]